MADTDITVNNLAATGGLGNIALTWGYIGAASPLPYLQLDHFEVWGASANDRSGATKITDTPDLNFTVTGLGYSVTRYYWVRAVDKSGNLGDWYPASSTGGVSGTTRATMGTSDLADDSVSTSKIQNDAVITAKINDAAIVANKLATDAVTSIKIAADAVTTAKIAVAAVVAASIDTGAVIAAKIGTGAVTTAKIAADAVTATELAANAVDAAAIQTGAVLTAKLAALAVTTAELANDAVTSAKILANTIVAGDIAANTITASQIFAGTITTTEIAANTIVAADIAAGTITATQIAAATITGANMVAYTISARELVLSDFSNILPDASFEGGSNTWTDVVGYNYANVQFISGSNAVSGGRYIQFPAGQTSPVGVTAIGVASRFFPVIPNEKFTIGATVALVNVGSGTAGYVVCRVDWYNSSNVYVSSDTVATVGPGAGSTLTATTSTIFTAPSTAVKCYMLCYQQSTGAGVATIGVGQLYNTFVRKAYNASLIVDGTITAAKIVAGTITANELAADSVTSAKILAGTIVASDIASATITGTQIAANTVAASNIVAGTITAREMVITDFSNLVPDPDFLSSPLSSTWIDIAGVNFGSIIIGTGSAIMRSGRYLYYPGGLSNPGLTYVIGVMCKAVPIEPGKEYAFGSNMGMEAGGTGSIYTDALWINAAGSVFQADNVGIRSTPGASDYSAIFTAPANAVAAAIRSVRYSTGAGVATVGFTYIGNQYIRKAYGGSLIVDGAITAAKVTAGTVTADLLVVGGKVITAHVTNNNISAISADIEASDVAITTSSYGVTTWVQISSATITPDGGQTIVMAQALLRSSLTHPDAFGACEARLKRDGTVVMTLTGFYDDFGTSQHPLTIFPFWYQDTVDQTTSHTYILEGRNANTVDGLYLEAAAGSGIVATNFKK